MGNIKSLLKLENVLSYIKSITSAGSVCFRDEKRCEKLNIFYILFLTVLVIAKMMLMANEEIMAYCLPHDDLWQIIAAGNMYWGDAYNTRSLFHLPIYPLFIGIVKMLGIPLRIAMDAAYCGASVFLLIALRRIGINYIICAIIGLAVMFNPASFLLPNRCGAEIFLAPLIMSAVAATILCFNYREKINIIDVLYSSFFWALAWNTRKESIVILGLFFVCIIFLGIVDFKLGYKKIIYRAFFIFIVPLIACGILSTAIKIVNKLNWGLYAKSIITAPGYTNAFKELQKISPKQHVDYVPITSDMRFIAYENSPSFRKLKPHLEGGVGRGWASCAGELEKGKPLEIQAGWVYWCFYDCAVAAGVANTATACDEFWSNVASELRAARLADNYESRPIYIAFIDPDIKAWINRVPESATRIYKLFWHPLTTYNRTTGDAEGSFTAHLFDKQANRRTYLIPSIKVGVEGWVTSSTGEIVNVSLEDDANRTHGNSQLYIRPDVDKIKNTGFRVKSNSIQSREELMDCYLCFTFLDKTKCTKRLKDIKIGCTLLKQNGKTITIGLDRVDFDRTTFGTWKTEVEIEKVYLYMTRNLSYLIIPCLILILLGLLFTQKSFGDTSIFCIFIMAVLICIRLVIFILLDATSWNGAQPRYIYPVMALYNTFLILVVWESLNSIYMIIKKIKTKLGMGK
jgi:hypothetical protein